MSEVTVAQHAILYADGGFDLNPIKISGMGVHGYTFINETPKKGTGNPKAVPTDKGYMFGDKIIGNKVTVVKYVDIVKGSRKPTTNNECELATFHEALLWLKDNPEITNVIIYSDSRFVVQGTNKHLPTWPDKKWLTGRGTPVPHRPLWEKVKETLDELTHLSMSLEWCEGHSGEVGNTTADALAWKGKSLAHNDDSDVIIEVRDAQGYWGIKNQIPRILQAPRWYFSTVDDDYVRPDGSYVYCVGSHGTKDKEDEFYGKRYADNFLGVVRVHQPDPVMECLRLNAISKDPRRNGSIVIGHLDAIFSPKTYKELGSYNTRFMKSGERKIDLLDSQKTEILVELTPVGLGFRGVRTWQRLNSILDQVLAGDSYYRITDITDLLYEDAGTKKPSRKLTSSVTQITKYIDTEVEFNLAKETDEPKPFKGKIRLILGGDILTRNQLAALADDVKSVKVVCWRESDNVGRYATMVELNSGDVGLWARTEANIYYAVKQN